MGKAQEEIAEATGITRPAYTMIEAGSRNPSVTMARKIGTIMNLDWTIFLKTKVTIRHKRKRLINHLRKNTKEVIAMTRQDMIQLLIQANPEVPASALEQMPDEQLRGHVEEWLSADWDQLAMG